MKMLVGAVFLAAAAVVAATDDKWRMYKETYGKHYTGMEDLKRREIWEVRTQMIQRHNQRYEQGLESYYMGENQFSDMTVEEFDDVMGAIDFPNEQEKASVTFQPTHRRHIRAVPETVDWRHYLPGIKRQGDCGSCWAFSAASAMEAAHYKVNREVINLSEQQLVDCTGRNSEYGNNGCKGGIPCQGFRYVIDAGGIQSNATYPYLAEQQINCTFDPSKIAARMMGYTLVEPGSEEDLKIAVAQHGPVSIGIGITVKWIQHKGWGVFDQPDCFEIATERNKMHAVLVVGYGTENGTAYWLVRNCHGTCFGEKGYIRMSRNKGNQCGIAGHAYYPIACKTGETCEKQQSPLPLCPKRMSRSPNGASSDWKPSVVWWGVWSMFSIYLVSK